MQIYILYAAVFITVILIIEGIWFLFRSRLSGDSLVNKRLKLINKTGQADIGLTLLRDQRERRLGNRAIAKLDSLIWASNLKINPYGLIILTVTLVVCLFLVLTVLGVEGRQRTIISMFFGTLPFGFVAMRARKRRKLFTSQLIPAVDLVSRGLQAGHPAAVALEIVSTEMPDPIGTEFGLAIDEINYGLDRTVALRNLGERFPSPDMQFFNAALEVQRETGGNLVEVLNNLTKMMRDRRALGLKVKSMSAEGRVTGWIVGLLPLIIVLVINLMMPSYYADHADNPTFWRIMAFPLTTYIIGVIWMKKLVSIKL